MKISRLNFVCNQYSTKLAPQQTQQNNAQCNAFYNNKTLLSSNYISKVNSANISFGTIYPTDYNKRTIQDIDYNTFVNLPPYKIEFYERKCNEFDNVLKANECNLYDKKYRYLPLKTERNMNEFIKASQIYTKFKEQPIISLGRSPKWFLDAATWMKDGIEGYKFVAFSKYWFWPDSVEGMKKLDNLAPTEEEIRMYRKYLNRIKADPKSIVEKFEQSGKKTVITDYISTGKGVTSFLDVMANYADDLGLLERFSKSIQIVGIGSMKYLEKFHHEDEYIAEPEVYMPPKLSEYRKNIQQEYHDLPYSMFEEMLLNQNTNECRSSYYPHQAWTVYQPDRFKTGLYKDINKIDKIVEDNNISTKTFNNFKAEMGDFRNYLRFRILNGLKQRNLLK